MQFRIHTGLAPIITFLVVCFVAAPLNAETNEPTRAYRDDGIMRFDPISDHLVSVPLDEVKPKYLYFHYNPKFNRQVWSFAEEGGTFGHALGPGTLQAGSRLDIQATEAEKMDRLRELAPQLAERTRVFVGSVFVRLNDDGEWDLAGRSGVSSIYDLETGRRWEWHAGRRIPITHRLGWQWEYFDGKYVPAGGCSSSPWHCEL
jgi:hypothetical protein